MIHISQANIPVFQGYGLFAQSNAFSFEVIPANSNSKQKQGLSKETPLQSFKNKLAKIKHDLKPKGGLKQWAIDHQYKPETVYNVTGRNAIPTNGVGYEILRDLGVIPRADWDTDDNPQEKEKAA